MDNDDYQTHLQQIKRNDTLSVIESLSALGEIHFVSLSCLWLGFAAASVYAAIQVYMKPNAVFRQNDVEQANGADGSSSGDTTRRLFYKLLFVALLSRFILLPVQVFASHTWLIFWAITFPGLTFASAWTVLVSFFVQLVGTAGGSPYRSTNSRVMQAIAYLMYGILLLTYLWNDSAVLLAYALLCIIYAALFATMIYFGPKLMAVLRPSLIRRSGLSLRLVTCCILCILIFGAQTVELARKVLLIEGQSKKSLEWWYRYGLLELFPAVSLLLMMQSVGKTASNGRSPSAAAGNTPPTPIQPLVSGFRRSQSASAGHSRQPAPSRGANENVALLKPASNAYGATGGADPS